MAILKILYDEIISFLGIDSLMGIFKSGNYSSLLTLDGILSAIGPLIPLLLIIEILRAVFYKRFKVDDYKVPFFIFVFNRFVSRFISIAAVAYIIALFEQHTIFKTGFTWYWLIYGYV